MNCKRWAMLNVISFADSGEHTSRHGSMMEFTVLMVSCDACTGMGGNFQSRGFVFVDASSMREPQEFVLAAAPPTERAAETKAW